MRKKLKRITLFSSALLFVTHAKIFAQENSTFVEKDLLNEKPKAAIEDNIKSKSDINISSLTDKIGSGISALFSNKANSLMFDDEENDAIDRAADLLKNKQVYSPESKEEEDSKKSELELAIGDNQKSYAYLASIMYLNPSEWVVWINDKKISSDKNKKGEEFYIKSIQKDGIKVIWTLSVSKWRILSGSKIELPKTNENNQVEILFNLKPNQSFSLTTKDVTEGNFNQAEKQPLSNDKPDKNEEKKEEITDKILSKEQ